MPVRLPAGLSLALGLVACGAPAEPPAGSEMAVPAAAPAAEAPVAAKPAPTAAAKAQIALDGEGLRLVDSESGAARALPFGSPAASALETLTRVQGAPPKRSTNPDCGAGSLEFARWDDGLSIVLQDGRFTGWSVNAPVAGPPLTTMSGVGLGSTRRELEAAYSVTVETTTLGQEFSAGELTGLLASDAADARITDLWAGTSCVFR